MNEEISREIINKLIAWIDGTVAFAQSQYPDVAQEILNSGYYRNLFDLLVCLSILVLFIGIAIFFYYLKANYTGDKYPPPYEVGIFTPLALCFPLLMGICASANNLINISFAPRMYVLEHLTSL